MRNRHILVFAALLALAACTPRIYKWEKNRGSVPEFADIDIVGAWHREPIDWDAARFAPHVSFTDSTGQERWLFEAFLFLEAQDYTRKRSFALGPDGVSATRDSWEGQLDRWLGKGGYVAELDKACVEVARRIGPPARKRYVVICIPDAVKFLRFGDKSSPTKYWGKAYGDSLDFASPEARIEAYKWYIDEARRRFAALRCKELELAGFYILSEELHASWGETEIERLNWQHKNWEEIIPAVADYVHGFNEGLWWVPYHMAPGHKYWKRFGFDMAYMQPNYYWDLKSPGRHPFHKTIEAVRQYGMGIEIEFEYSCVTEVMQEVKAGPDGAGKLIFHEEDVTALKNMLREYFRQVKDNGLYGTVPIAIYSGSNALTQLATSAITEDVDLYNELCYFTLDNPLRNE